MERPQVLSTASSQSLPYHYERGVARSRRQEGERGRAGDLEGKGRSLRCGVTARGRLAWLLGLWTIFSTHPLRFRSLGAAAVWEMGSVSDVFLFFSCIAWRPRAIGDGERGNSLAQ
jgi:hypothetical protein